MRTRVHTHTHTFHDEAEEEFARLAQEEKRLTRVKASQPDEGAPRRRMSEPAEDVDAALADVRAKMAEQQSILDSGRVRITFKGLTRGEFRRLLTAHPPREGDRLDQAVGYNGDTFLDAFVSSSIVATHNLAGDPVENEWPKWGDEMTNGQWEKILKLCQELTNSGEPTFPR